MQLKENKRCMQDFSLLENFEEKNCTGAEKLEPRVVIQNLGYFIRYSMWPFLACKLKSDSKLLNLNRIRIRSKSDFGMAEFSSIFFVTFYYQKKFGYSWHSAGMKEWYKRWTFSWWKVILRILLQVSNGLKWI